MTGIQSIFHLWGHEQVPYINRLLASTGFLSLYYDYIFFSYTAWGKKMYPLLKLAKLNFDGRDT